MKNQYLPAKRETMYFIGVTTRQSSIMKVFPAWSDHLGLAAEIRGFDFQPHDEPTRYRECVAFIKNDPLSRGALVTTHKLDLLNATRDLFDGLGLYALQLNELSSISKRGPQLWGNALDPISSGLALETFVPVGYWQKSGAEVLILGAGGSSLALTVYLINKAKQGKDAPGKIAVTNRSPARLEEMRRIHNALFAPIAFEYHLCPTPADNDRVLSSMKPGSLVINATGLGKDAPGSPLTDRAVFPENGLAWDFNYRGELAFLRQADGQWRTQALTVEDGWTYFIHGWVQGIADIFNIDIPVRGAEFDELKLIAARFRN